MGQPWSSPTSLYSCHLSKSKMVQHPSRRDSENTKGDGESEYSLQSRYFFQEYTAAIPSRPKVFLVKGLPASSLR